MKKRILLLLLVMTLAVSAFSLYSCVNKKDGSSGADTTKENAATTDSSSETVESSKGTPAVVTKHKYGDFDYWLSSPAITDDGLPLIVYLHDESDGGNGIDAMIKNEGLTKMLYEGGVYPNAYVLIPNLSKTEKNWYDVKYQLETLISLVSSANKIDPSKIYLTGVGKGATGVYEIAMSMPTAFAAFAPVGGTAPNIADIEKLKNVKIAAYVGINIEDSDSAAISDFLFELGKINKSIEVFTLENYNASNYVRIYSDMEYNLLETLIGY